jgi:hypothetical protein
MSTQAMMEDRLYDSRHMLPSALLTGRSIALCICQVRDKSVSGNYLAGSIRAPPDRTYMLAFINLHGRNNAI